MCSAQDPCPKGKYNSDTSNRTSSSATCTECTGNTYSDDPGALECKQCWSGTTGGIAPLDVNMGLSGNTTCVSLTCGITNDPNLASNTATYPLGSCVCKTYYSSTIQAADNANGYSGSCIKNCNNKGTLVGGTCNCYTGWSGTHCNVFVDPCDGIVCQNGGSCINGSCNCINNWTGTYCQTPGVQQINCGSNGTRLSNNTCQCDTNYTGSHCQDKDCGSHGYYSNNTCNCQPNYSGEFCQTFSEPDPCDNNFYDGSHWDQARGVPDGYHASNYPDGYIFGGEAWKQYPREVDRNNGTYVNNQYMSGGMTERPCTKEASLEYYKFYNYYLNQHGGDGGW
jgi:Notch-like protein